MFPYFSIWAIIYLRFVFNKVFSFMQKISNIAKNTSYLTLALVLQKIISFSYFTFLARELSPEYLGKYYFAISFTTIFAVFIDFGMTNVLTREVAKKPENSNKLLSQIIITKLFFSLIVIAFIFVAINLLGYDSLSKKLVYLSVICIFLDSFTASFFGVIRGFHNLKFESIASIVFQIIVMAFGLFALYSGFGLLTIMFALVLASLFNVIFSFTVLKSKFKLKLDYYFNFHLAKSIILISIPFGIFAVFQRFYTYLDTVFLSLFAGDAQVGYYQVAFKIVFALQFLPSAFMASLYPAMSSYWISNKEQLAITFERAVNYLLILSLPISAGIIILSDKIVLLFKGDYSQAILPMQIIMISLIFIFLNFPIGSLLNACDRQRKNTINMGIAVFASIILNLILIPKFQAVGASITVLATNFLMFLLGISIVVKIININIKRISLLFIKAILSTIIMGIAVLFLKTYFNIFIVVLTGALIYFIFLYLLGGFKKADISSIYNSFLKQI